MLTTHHAGVHAWCQSREHRQGRVYSMRPHPTPTSAGTASLPAELGRPSVLCRSRPTTAPGRTMCRWQQQAGLLMCTGLHVRGAEHRRQESTAECPLLTRTPPSQRPPLTCASRAAVADGHPLAELIAYGLGHQPAGARNALGLPAQQVARRIGVRATVGLPAASQRVTERRSRRCAAACSGGRGGSSNTNAVIGCGVQVGRSSACVRQSSVGWLGAHRLPSARTRP